MNLGCDPDGGPLFGVIILPYTNVGSSLRDVQQTFRNSELTLWQCGSPVRVCLGCLFDLGMIVLDTVMWDASGDSRTCAANSAIGNTEVRVALAVGSGCV